MLSRRIHVVFHCGKLSYKALITSSLSANHEHRSLRSMIEITTTNNPSTRDEQEMDGFST